VLSYITMVHSISTNPSNYAKSHQCGTCSYLLSHPMPVVILAEVSVSKISGRTVYHPGPMRHAFPQPPSDMATILYVLVFSMLEHSVFFFWFWGGGEYFLVH
jgi:hypothetical protein